MHEISIMQSILDIAIEHASANNANIIKKINLRIGELSGIVPEWMQSYFEMLSSGTIAAKAEVIVQWVPAVIKCRECGKEYRLTKEDPGFLCLGCGSTKVDLISGREYFIESIEVD
jgi:hydrogenase nickel incorporation protein HypA/HybF